MVEATDRQMKFTSEHDEAEYQKAKETEDKILQPDDEEDPYYGYHGVYERRVIDGCRKRGMSEEEIQSWLGLL